MKSKLILMAVVYLLLLPALASAATHFNSLTDNANCDYWAISAGILWRPGAVEGTLDYSISLLDEDMNIIDLFTEEEVVIEQGDNPQLYFMIFNLWSSYEALDDGAYTFRAEFSLVAPYDGGVDEDSIELETEFTCGEVPVEDHSWSAVKDLYR